MSNPPLPLVGARSRQITQNEAVAWSCQKSYNPTPYSLPPKPLVGSNNNIDLNSQGIKLQTSYNTVFYGISTGKSIYRIIFVIQGDLQGKKNRFQGQIYNNIIFNKYK